MNQRLNKFIDRLGENVAVVKLLVGSSRKMQTEAIFVIEPHEPILKNSDIVAELINLSDMEELIINEAENVGWGTDHTHMRINAKDIEGNHLKSLTLSRSLEHQDEPILNSANHNIFNSHMAAALDRSTRAVVDCLHLVTNDLAHERAINSENISLLMEARRDQIEAEGQSMAMSLSMDADDNSDKMSMTSEAITQLTSIAQTIMGAKKAPTAAEFIEMIDKYTDGDPNLIKAALANEKIAGKIMEAYMATQSPTED